MGLLSMLDLAGKDVVGILDLADSVKASSERYRGFLSGKTLAMLFEKPSTRTRVSFEVAMVELGGNALVLDAQDMQLGRGESVADTARVLGGYVDGIMARVVRHETLDALARFAGVPVINGLSDREHPCQVLSDLFTIREVKNRLSGLNLAYVGDGNNVCNSLLIGCVLSGMNITVASPKKLRPDRFFVDKATEIAGEKSVVRVVDDPAEAVSGADVVYSDVWVSMGDEAEREERLHLLRGYQVNSRLMANAKGDAVFMHCLPAHRGEEVTDEVIDSERSVVWRQAENRLHVQKAVLLREMR